MNFDYPPGTTIIDLDEAEGLIHSHLKLREQTVSIWEWGIPRKCSGKKKHIVPAFVTMCCF
jgi:hypothetical protein